MSSNLERDRVRYFDGPFSDFRRYHRSEREIAGLLATETCHPAGFEVPRHAHELASFYVVLEGSLSEFYDRHRRDVGASSVVFTPPGEIHRDTFHDGGGRCFLVELTAGWTERLAAAGVPLDRSFEARDEELTWLTPRLYREFRDADAVSPIAVEGLGLEILAALSRGSTCHREPPLPAWLRRVRDLLHDRFAETLTLDEIAGQVAVHPVHLARAFRRQFRCSVGEYQRRLRLEHATRELLTTRRPLGEIALAAGFADQAHFSRRFKSRTGMTPARYRATFGVG